jgi:uncharacterized membrane protein (DUF106 family)
MFNSIASFILAVFLAVVSIQLCAQPKDSITKQQQLNRIKKEKLRTPIKISEAQKTADTMKVSKRKKSKNSTTSKQKHRSRK